MMASVFGLMTEFLLSKRCKALFRGHTEQRLAALEKGPLRGLIIHAWRAGQGRAYTGLVGRPNRRTCTIKTAWLGDGSGPEEATMCGPAVTLRADLRPVQRAGNAAA